LFQRIQLSGVFDDSKYFPDMEPTASPDVITSRFKIENPKSKDELAAFVRKYFLPPRDFTSSCSPSRGEALGEHIHKLWKCLHRKADSNVAAASSLIPLPYDYVVPGGRFREIYYWDSYFTSLGLIADSETELFKSMVSNFDSLIKEFGRMPNGNRDYYRSRSQPPFFSLMVALWRTQFGRQSAVRFLPELKAEHAFWLSGARAVKMPDGSVLARYWDDAARPRSESYREDVELAKRSRRRAPEELYRELRAGAESGWDFSSRWFSAPLNLETIQTTDFIPVDLNALLYHLESLIAELSLASGASNEARDFLKLAEKRKQSVSKYLWDEMSATFRDYNWKRQAISPRVTVAMVTPLFVGLASPEQAKGVALALAKDFLKSGGLVTTLHVTGQQWDAPNGWAPHQWMGYVGLMRFGEKALAQKIRSRWMAVNERIYKATGKMMEKYNVVDPSVRSGGGEYPTQDGFGCTNGVYRAFQTPEISMSHLK
jgi:alpha,alpha-trehalase